MNPIGSNSIAAQTYGGVQKSGGGISDTSRVASGVQAPSARSSEQSSFTVPRNATPQGDWVLAENANPQSFDASSPRGSYLNLVV